MKHVVRWFVYTGNPGQPNERIPRTATMRGRWPGYDAVCSCGWESHTGGGVRSYIEQKIWEHKRGLL
jgi:hypothetical protein